MRCPRCECRVVTFLAWAVAGPSLRRLDCPDCGAPLKFVGRRAFGALLLMVALWCSLVIGVLFLFDRLGLNEPVRSPLLAALSIPLALGVIYPFWKTGRYQLRESSEPGNQEPPDVHRLTIGRWAFVVVICLGLIMFLGVRGHRDLLLTFGAYRTAGRIVRVHQPPPGRFRESDYQVQYEFHDGSGALHSGSDVLPPAKPPPADGRIEVRYRPGDPSVSRIASQWLGMPLMGILFASGTVFWVTIRFVRERRAASREEARSV